MRYDAINHTVELMRDYYKESAEKTTEVLVRNQSYFASPSSIKQMVMIGHSLPEVDDPYFREIIKNHDNTPDVEWYISWYNPDDLGRIGRFMKRMGLDKKQVKLSRVQELLSRGFHQGRNDAGFSTERRLPSSSLSGELDEKWKTMNIARRKGISEEWKHRHPEMGVISFRCKDIGDLSFGTPADTKTDYNSNRFKLPVGNHPSKKMQALWNQYGEDKFDYEVVKVLEYEDANKDHTDKLEELRESCFATNPQAGRIWR